MIDEQAIHADMQRIFAAAPTVPSDRTVVRTATPSMPPVPAPRRRFMGREGIAAAGFALAVTAIGLFAAPLLTRSAPPARPTAVVMAAPAPVAAAPMVAPAVPATPPTSLATTTPSAPAAATPIASVSRAAGPRRARPYRARRVVVRHRAWARHRPGAHTALQRALARDAVLTRRLNQQVLRGLQTR